MITELKMKKYDIDELVNIKMLINNQNDSFDCDFHEDDGSASIVDNHYKCTCCGVDLTASQYIAQTKGISRIEALAYLYRVNKQSIPDWLLEQVRPNIKLLKINSDLSKICNEKLFDDTESSKNALKYLLEDRRLSLETIEKFSLGFFPKDKNFLNDLISKYGKNELLELGIISEGEFGLYSMFANRVIFPISNNMGQICGFGSRRLDGVKKNKYINSQQSRLFNKSELLYKERGVSKGVGIITEGYMDVISCSQNEPNNSYYAALGVALSAKHVRDVLKKHEKAVICTDADNAGIEATKKFIKESLRNIDLNKVGFVLLPENLDPDEFINEYGREKFQDLINNSINAREFISIVSDSNDEISTLETYDKFRI